LASPSTPSRLGQEIGAGDAKAIFLEVFAGMVLEKFDTMQITKDRTLVRNIKNGKSAQFPLTWDATASYHTPGDELVGQVIKHHQKSISIEDLLVADVFVDVLDEAMNHYEVRSIYAHQLGEALANAYDKNNFRVLRKGSQASHLIDTSGDNDGTTLDVAGISTDAALMKAAIYDSAQTLDEKNVPGSERTAALLPSAWYLLLEDGHFIHRDYGNEGSQARAKLAFAADLQVVKSNNIPIIDETGDTSLPVVARANSLGLQAVIWHKSASGVVKLLDLKTEEGYDIRRQGTLLVAKYALGQDFLRPECCVTVDDTAIV
jgi:hypothetical protein